MERFTFRTVGGTAVLYLGNSSEWAIISGRNNHEYKISGDAVDRLAAYEDTGLEPEEIYEVRFLIAAQRDPQKLARLRELVLADQDGRLVVLPQKTVWELTMDAGPDCDMKCPVDAWDESLGCDLCSKAKQFAYERPCTQERLKELGKTVFLTREEAKAALVKKGGEG